MLEVMKCIALSIAVIGFGLSVLAPLFLHFKTEVQNSSNIIKVLVLCISVIVLVLYFTILFYFIWIYNGFI
ncbi:membrane protein [Cronobacter phage vB_CsaM_GAP32]|uniref:Putative membrane protein n=1 Tax=Cronobacter phage vB_CsaM_GAP32 TaxID=1141136 RepID=K4F6J6_9CAUD|nr:membrane protein [Cronobacter phage vB_CsaM_GAP32]AFC21563.1 putative membrane protein [Cronobacter phage vB_CsaM_GAP32]